MQVLIPALFVGGCSRPSTDPPPFTNLSPTVSYVGSKACASCHQEVFDTYSKSEMGRSMSRLDQSNIIELFPQKTPVHDPVKDYFYEMIERDGKFYQREFRRDDNGRLIHERLVEAQYVMGSGNNLRMYFNDQNGMLYELPLTWYVHKKEWDLSPGYRDHENLRFSRFAGAKCLSCHNSYLVESPDAIDRFVPPYDLGIGCERCHGPGELHIQEEMESTRAETSDPRPSIVNPATLPPKERLAVCQQCHLMGKAWVLKEMDNWFGYRPGVPLETHRSVYVPERTLKEVIEVGDSPQRLALSACFRKSEGSLTCITCHDPHVSIKTFTPAHYNQRCLGCHPAATRSIMNGKHPHRETDNCITCHMNQTGSDNTLHGVSNTDHWIRIDAGESEIDWSLVRRPPGEKEVVKLVPFIDAVDGGELLRQGMAYSYYFREHDNRALYIDSALFYLRPGVQSLPNDAQGHFRLGEALRERGEDREALEEFRRALALSPGAHRIQFELAGTYARLGESDSAISSFRKAVKGKPANPQYIEGLATSLARIGQWGESLSLFEHSLLIDSTNYLAHFYIGNILGRYLGEPSEAVSHYRASLVLEPDHQETRTNLGNTYYLLGDFRNALREYELQVDRWPGTYEAWVNMGRVHLELKDREEAKRALGKAIQLRPDLPAAFEILEQIGTR